MINKGKKLIAGMTTAIMTLGIFTGCTSGKEVQNNKVEDKNIVNVYSARNYDVDKELFKKFEEQTGIKVNLVEGKSDELIERMSREGDKSSADMFLTVGAESISLLKEKNLVKEISSDIINTNIPKEYRGEDWVGLTSRARIIAYDKDRVNPENIKTYSDLLKPEYKGKILARSSTSSYNIAMLSSFIQEDGEEKAKEWAQGVVNNLARIPEGNDRDQVKAIAAGIGDVAIINSYYIAKMVNSSDVEEVNASRNIGLIFPEETHINLSFGSITKSAKNQENAIKLLEFLTSEEAQSAYAEANGEFPLNQKVELPELLKSWGEFETQHIDFEKLGENKQKATLIFDQVGWK
ncbi:Fe(3+) ABC transporter substrate-binding protein [Clostridium sp.]|uniref:Fe(3+) ABC transporter substrate-binding protein n=1 Tax=Clostridium sp. TaxID=1506 RepID=UPI00321769E8